MEKRNKRKRQETNDDYELDDDDSYMRNLNRSIDFCLHLLKDPNIDSDIRKKMKKEIDNYLAMKMKYINQLSSRPTKNRNPPVIPGILIQ